MFLFEYLKMTTYFEEEPNKKDGKAAMFGEVYDVDEKQLANAGSSSSQMISIRCRHLP
jgi:hypothetical protein